MAVVLELVLELERKLRPPGRPVASSTLTPLETPLLLPLLVVSLLVDERLEAALATGTPSPNPTPCPWPTAAFALMFVFMLGEKRRADVEGATSGCGTCAAARAVELAANTAGARARAGANLEPVLAFGARAGGVLFVCCGCVGVEAIGGCCAWNF